MEIQHYVAALVAIGALNWAVRRFGSHRANKLTFIATAGMPILLWIGLIAFLLVRDGVSTFQGRYFSILLMIVGACTVATSAVALLGQTLGRPRKGARNR
jgi:asparagine N-glycosylation enzyme membrane subunit Stt3